MKNITDRIYTFSGLTAGRVYLIDDGPGQLTLVDAGLRSAVPRIIKQINEMGYSVEDIVQIIVTHAHPDHIGGLPELALLSGAEIIAHTAEATIVEGKAPIPRANGRVNPPPPGTPVTWQVVHGDTLNVLDGMRILHTPGHAPGHLCLWYEAQRVLFCGDVILNLGGLRLPPAQFTQDTDENKLSIQMLAELAPDVLCCGHGPVVTNRTAAKLNAFVARWSKQ